MDELKPKITQISKEDLKVAQDCMEAAGLLGAKQEQGRAEITITTMAERGQSATSPAKDKLEIKNAQTVALVIVQENDKATIRLLLAEITPKGMTMGQLSQEVAGNDLENTLSCAALKASRSR